MVLAGWSRLAEGYRGAKWHTSKSRSTTSLHPNNGLRMRLSPSRDLEQKLHWESWVLFHWLHRQQTLNRKNRLCPHCSLHANAHVHKFVYRIVLTSDCGHTEIPLRLRRCDRECSHISHVSTHSFVFSLNFVAFDVKAEVSSLYFCPELLRFPAHRRHEQFAALFCFLCGLNQKVTFLMNTFNYGVVLHCQEILKPEFFSWRQREKENERGAAENSGRLQHIPQPLQSYTCQCLLLKRRGILSRVRPYPNSHTDSLLRNPQSHSQDRSVL